MTEREAFERLERQRKVCREKPACRYLRCICLELEGAWMAAKAKVGDGELLSEAKEG